MKNLIAVLLSMCQLINYALCDQSETAAQQGEYSAGQSITAHRLGNVYTKVTSVHSLVEQIFYLEPVLGKPDHYIGAAIEHLSGDGHSFLFSFEADLIEDTAVRNFVSGEELRTKFRGFALTSTLVVFTLQQHRGAILKTSIDFPRREDLSGDHHDDDEQNYDFLVNWMSSGEFSEGGDAKTNSFIDPTALAFDYQSNKLYVMDREAVRFIDMMTLKAYTLHSDKSSDIKMGISPNTQPGLMRYDGHLWIAFAYGIAKVPTLKPTENKPNQLEVFVGRSGYPLYRDGNISHALFSTLSSFVVWHDEVILASNLNHDDPHAMRVVDLSGHSEGQVTSACHHVTDRNADTKDGPAYMCSSNDPIMLLVLDKDDEHGYAVLSEPGGKIRIVELRPINVVAFWAKWGLRVAVLSTLGMGICVMLARFGTRGISEKCQRKKMIRVASTEMGKTGTGGTNHYYKKPKSKTAADKLKKSPFNDGQTSYADAAPSRERTQEEFWDGVVDENGKKDKPKKDKKADNGSGAKEKKEKKSKKEKDSPYKESKSPKSAKKGSLKPAADIPDNQLADYNYPQASSPPPKGVLRNSITPKAVPLF